MTVFKAYMKIMKNNFWVILLYLCIFLGVTILVQAGTKKSDPGSFETTSLTIGIVDQDGGRLSKGFQDYLAQFHKIEAVKNDKSVLQEKLYYNSVDYIIRIPKDFKNKCLVQGEQLPVTSVPGSYNTLYVDQQINSFLNNARVYASAGFSEEEIVSSLNSREQPKVTISDDKETKTDSSGLVYFFRYMPYLFLAALGYVMGYILSSMRKGDFPQRMRASAVPLRRQNIEGLLASGVIALGLWLACILFASVAYKGGFLQSKNLIYYILNSFSLLLVSLAIAYLIGMLTSNINALNGVVNILSLGMCFLCGVFVPLELLGKGVKTLSQFLPIYWYERANELLGDYSTLTSFAKGQMFEYIGIQFVFFAAVVCLVAVISKRQGS